jgi:hypothetical protein
MSSLNKVSPLIKSQLPEFIREEHPVFVEFLQRYYEYLELPGNPIHELKRFSENYDPTTARAELLKYFRTKILPSFPEDSELSTEKILLAAKSFYTKKGTPDSFKFLFKVLYDKDLEIYFPKSQILKASDGKWVLPQAFRLTLSAPNVAVDLNRLEGRKAYGSISRASCVIESAIRTIDKSTNREIVEIYISNINRFFQNGESIEIEYIDENDDTQTFSEKIIGAISNVRINPNRRGRKYSSGDPVVINGGLDTTSETRIKAVAVVGNVTTGSIDSVSVLKRGYGFRTAPNSLVDIISANGVGANVIISGTDDANAIPISYGTDSILYKANSTLNSTDYGFDNVASANINTVLRTAFTFQVINLAPIFLATAVSGGAFFDAEPELNAISLYESDYSTDEGLILVSPGEFNTYNNVNSSIRLSGGAYSSTNDWYNGYRIFLEKQYRTVIDYDGATKTLFLNRPFEVNINQTNILTRNLYLDARPIISDTGRIAHIEVLNGGSGYSATNAVIFVGTGYNAAATIAVSGTGAITAVSLSDRGEGYPIAPDVSVTSLTGSGAVLRAIMFSDGEEFDVVTSDIGQIKDFVVLNRGSDYVTTPNVSLKIYDLFVSSISESESILENDIVYQGPNSNSTTFRATVDSHYPTNNIIRVFNFSGVPSVGQNLVIYKANSANINVQVLSANVDGKVYPYRYGDGRARANAEFLNGLIKYNGFYLNTDGHLSSDKKLQGANTYHNFSYSLVSEVQFTDYKKTVYDVAHPAGTKLIPTFVVRDGFLVPQRTNSNAHVLVLTSNSLTTNCNVGYESTTITGINENFDVVANANDIIIINSSNAYRSFAKVIAQVTNNNSMTVESPCVLIGEGRARTNTGNAAIQISGNVNTLPSFIDTGDRIKISVSNTVLTKTINSIVGNVITLNSNTGITTSNTNLIYSIHPQFNVVNYEIIKTVS